MGLKTNCYTLSKTRVLSEILDMETLKQFKKNGHTVVHDNVHFIHIHV